MTESLLACLTGNEMPPALRIWSAAAPALLLVAWVFVGMLVYALRNRRHGRFVDEEMLARGSTPLLGMWLRQYFAWLMRPVVGLLLRLQLPANTITTLSTLLATGAGVALAAGRFAFGGWLLVASAICDFLDGRIARVTHTAGPRGAVLDSVLDRYADAAVFLGLAWFYRESWVLLPVLVALMGSMLVPYVRARAEALGADLAGVGLMQRPERVVVLGASVALSPIVEAILVPGDPRPVHRLAVVGVLVIATATQITVIQRLMYATSALDPQASGWRMLGRGGMARTGFSAAVATGADMALVVALVEHEIASPATATFVGALLGAICNFTINRVWSFGSRGPYVREIARYVLVSGTSAGLNAGGVLILLLLPSTPYLLAWTLARAAVFATWNYPLHRDYVFSGSRGLVAEEDARAM